MGRDEAGYRSARLDLRTAPPPVDVAIVPDTSRLMPTANTEHKPTLVIRQVRGMGRGVFAARSFRARTVIEACRVLVLSAGTDETLGGLEHYVFKWGPDEDRLAIALGYGSLYNHSTRPNADFTLRHKRGVIVFQSLRAIAAGEQILIDYRWEKADYVTFRQPKPQAAQTARRS